MLSNLVHLANGMEKLLEQEYPAYYHAITEQWERTFKNWIAFHNEFTKDNITHILSLRDYESTYKLSCKWQKSP